MWAVIRIRYKIIAVSAIYISQFIRAKRFHCFCFHDNYVFSCYFIYKMFLLFLVDVAKLSGFFQCLCYCFVIVRLNTFCYFVESSSDTLYIVFFRFGQSLERVLGFKNLLLFIIISFFYLLLLFLIDVAKLSGFSQCLCYCFVIVRLNTFCCFVESSSDTLYIVFFRFGQSLERVLGFKNLLLFIIISFFYLLLLFLIDVAKLSGFSQCLCYCFVIIRLIFSCFVLKNSLDTLYNVQTLEPPEICLVSQTFKSFRYFLLFMIRFL